MVQEIPLSYVQLFKTEAGFIVRRESTVKMQQIKVYIDTLYWQVQLNKNY